MFQLRSSEAIIFNCCFPLPFSSPSFSISLSSPSLSFSTVYPIYLPLPVSLFLSPYFSLPLPPSLYLYFSLPPSPISLPLPPLLSLFSCQCNLFQTKKIFMAVFLVETYMIFFSSLLLFLFLLPISCSSPLPSSSSLPSTSLSLLFPRYVRTENLISHLVAFCVYLCWASGPDSGGHYNSYNTPFSHSYYTDVTVPLENSPPFPYKNTHTL